MAERIKMTCSCGATMETESSLISTVSDRQKWFQNAHILCLEAQQETPDPFSNSKPWTDAWRSAQQETPASASQPTEQPAPSSSEVLSALIPGPVVKRYGSAIASLDTSRGQFHLTVETGVSSKSILFTWREWGAICQLFSTPQPTSESLTPSGSTKDGGRGAASPDPSPESAAPSATESSEVSHDEAARAMGNLVASAFRQRHGATFSIPVRGTDDDMVLSRYISQQRNRDPSRTQLALERDKWEAWCHSAEVRGRKLLDQIHTLQHPGDRASCTQCVDILDTLYSEALQRNPDPSPESPAPRVDGWKEADVEAFVSGRAVTLEPESAAQPGREE